MKICFVGRIRILPKPGGEYDPPWGFVEIYDTISRKSSYVPDSDLTIFKKIA
jgi:hypothetical protein